MLRGSAAAACLACCALSLTACGGGGSSSTQAKRCEARALARLQSDVGAIRRAAALPGADNLDGNAAVNRATDRFLRDAELAPIDNLARNRMIDHAAGALAGACEQCFQALEAARPIVNIRVGEASADC